MKYYVSFTCYADDKLVSGSIITSDAPAITEVSL